MSDRRTEEQTNNVATDQTVDATAQPVPALVVPPLSGESPAAHAQTFSPESGDHRVSVDTTTDLVLEVPSDEDWQTDGHELTL